MASARSISPAMLSLTAIYLLVWPGVVLGLSGDLRWPEAWVFSVWFLALCGGTIAWLYKHDPALLAERYRMPGSGGQRGWDRAVVIGLGVGFAAWIATMPLDHRGHWSPVFPKGLEALGGALLIAAAFLLFRAFRDNTFLSPLVRVQGERAQHVVSTGVYGFVRHPMYLGAITMFVGGPLLLGSLAGLAVGAALSVLLAGRIVGEERLLVRDLEGYEAYRERVRYRLLPHVW
jgi:protein-S-isoprenylcysteine O-methyltransferase Ste14